MHDMHGRCPLSFLFGRQGGFGRATRPAYVKAFTSSRCNLIGHVIDFQVVVPTPASGDAADEAGILAAVADPEWTSNDVRRCTRPYVFALVLQWRRPSSGMTNGPLVVEHANDAIET